MQIQRIERPRPDWPVARAVQVMYASEKAPEEARQLGSVKELSERWKLALTEA
jgi:MOSC domain-containing protein YiiM